MTEINRFNLITQDPEIYYDYYNEKYKITLDIIERLEKKNMPPENMLPTRIKLGELAGKRAISIGILRGKPFDKLNEYWELLCKDLLIADKSFENTNKFENTVLYIQRKCVNE